MRQCSRCFPGYFLQTINLGNIDQKGETDTPANGMCVEYFGMVWWQIPSEIHSKFSHENIIQNTTESQLVTSEVIKQAITLH